MLYKWFENGQPFLSAKYSNGIEHGIVKQWYENGNLEFQMEYDFGLAKSAKYWNEDGTKKENP